MLDNDCLCELWHQARCYSAHFSQDWTELGWTDWLLFLVSFHLRRGTLSRTFISVKAWNMYFSTGKSTLLSLPLLCVCVCAFTVLPESRLCFSNYSHMLLSSLSHADHSAQTIRGHSVRDAEPNTSWDTIWGSRVTKDVDTEGCSMAL